jgi:hypothetical protein
MSENQACATCFSVSRLVQHAFPRTENVPKKTLLKVECFQLQNFFRRKICVGQSHFTNISFCGKFSRLEMGL